MLPSEHREYAKIYRYRKISGVDVDDPNSIVPFAMDASGRLGARGSAFLGRIFAASSKTHPALELARNLKLS